MGTWDSSKIRVSRRERDCCRSSTHPHRIAVGERYLDYMFGQRNHVPVCLDCALHTYYSDSTTVLRYDCAAVQTEMEARER